MVCYAGKLFDNCINRACSEKSAAETVQFALSGGTKEVVSGWYGDVSFEPLEGRE